MRLALFDLDNTLLAGDSDYEWGQFLIDAGVVDRGEYESRNREFYEQYKAGTLDIHAFLAFALAPLARHSPEQLARWHDRFMAERILPMIGAPARALVDRHRDDLRAVVTATNAFVTTPIARAFGIEHLLATEPERAQGRYTGRVSGVPCFREGKVQRLEQWLAERGLRLEDFESSVFYSDSANDLPLLERVTHPIVVDPDERLRETARSRGWPVISLHGGGAR
jgi:HAD superfamily hydrolase (TIGR01490 family)